MPGPPPNKHARRRNARPDWVSLPAEGHKGRIPAWPLPGMVAEDGVPSSRPKATAAERALWRQLWRTPQAEQWSDLGWTRAIARYCRMVVLSEQPKASASLISEVRQMEDRLGLTPMSMKRLQWEVDSEVAVDSGPDDVARMDDYRVRLAQ